MLVCSCSALSICISVYGISTTLQPGPGPEHTQRIRFKHGWWRQNWFASSYSNSLVSWLFRNWPCSWNEYICWLLLPNRDHTQACVADTEQSEYKQERGCKNPALCPHPQSWGEQSNCCGLISLTLFTLPAAALLTADTGVSSYDYNMQCKIVVNIIECVLFVFCLGLLENTRHRTCLNT